MLYVDSYWGYWGSWCCRGVLGCSGWWDSLMGCGLAVLKYFLFVLVYLSLCYSKTLVPKSAKIIANAKEFFFS